MAEIKYGHVVKSADGALYSVRYVHQAHGDADLSPLDGTGGSVTLPLAELRRVADPRNRKPPIEALPTDRPGCVWCQRKFRPFTNDEYGGQFNRVIKRTFAGWRSYRGLFCTLACALRFAEASYRGGYRRVVK